MLDAALHAEIANALSRRESLAVVTIVRAEGSVPRRTGAKMIIRPDGSTVGTIGGGIFELLVIRDALDALKRGSSETKQYSFNPKGVNDGFGAVCGGTADVFIEVLMPADRLLIVGGGHCGRALAKAAALLDFAIVVVDDRDEYARPEDYPEPGVEAVIHASTDYRELPPIDTRTYVVLVTKGFLTDEAALRRVVDSPAAYVGMIGSLRKREAVYEKLRADGIPEAKLARVHAPIGLEIGAETPEEIAVSILAEIIRVRASQRNTASGTAHAG